MARQMNVETRLGTLRKTTEKANAAQVKANEIAEELTAHFKGNRSPEAKQALQAAKAAKKMAVALGKVAEISI